jgi:hypothetical protein
MAFALVAWLTDVDHSVIAAAAHRWDTWRAGHRVILGGDGAVEIEARTSTAALVVGIFDVVANAHVVFGPALKLPPHDVI